MARTDESIKSSWTSTLASAAVVIAALYMAKSLLVPLTLAMLLSFLLMPVCDWLERWRLGRFPAALVTAVLGFTMLGIMAWIAVVQMTHLAPQIPEYQNNIQAKLRLVNEYAANKLSQISIQASEVGQNPLLPDKSPEPTKTLKTAGYAEPTISALKGEAGVDMMERLQEMFNFGDGEDALMELSTCLALEPKTRQTPCASQVCWSQ